MVVGFKVVGYGGNGGDNGVKTPLHKELDAGTQGAEG